MNPLDHCDLAGFCVDSGMPRPPHSSVTRQRSAAAPRRTVFGVLGGVLLGLTVVLVTPGILIYLSGNDVALLLVIVGFGVFVTAIGFLAAARAAQ